MNKAPEFITNEPCGEDLLTGKSQSTIAGSISLLIKTKKFKLIGLQGEWGSGKSNLIGILQKLLAKDHHFFIYDAWSHQEDLQRRSFLEELTDDLQHNDVVNQKTWTAKLDDLLAKKIKHKTTIVPKLSAAIITSILVTVLIPILKTITDGLPNMDVIYKALIVISPIIIALLVWVVTVLKSTDRPREWDISKWFFIYKEKELTKEVSEMISEKEPSVQQFRNWMNTLSTAILDNLNKSNIKEVVVVFDNMDRLPKEKVKSLWSLIHTFFAESKNKFSHITVIVPFDFKHIRAAFEHDANEEEITDHFISKTFPIIFNVPPPITTDWEDFFVKKYQEAFGSSEKDEIVITQNIFDLYQDAITPRRIISFINDLVSLKLIWQDQIAMRYLAIYVLSRKTILKDPLKEISIGNFAKKAERIFHGDESLFDNIAALTFNIKLEKASQVVLTREIQVQFRESNFERLKDLSRSADFISILRQVAIKSNYSIIEVAPMLEKLEEDPSSGLKGNLDHIWEIIARSQIGQQMSPVSFDTAYQIILLKLKDKKQATNFIKYLTEQYSKESPFNGPNYYIMLDSLERFLKDKNLPNYLLSYVIKKQVSPSDFLIYVQTAKEFYKRFKVETNENQLQEHLINSLNVQQPVPNYWALVYLKDYSMGRFLGEIERRISKDDLRPENFLQIFDAYKKVSPHRPLLTKLSDTKINEMLDREDGFTPIFYELAAMRMAIGKEFPALSGKSNSILEMPPELVAEGISNNIEYYKNLGDLMVDASTWVNSLLKAIVKILISNKSPQSIIHLQQLLANFEGISSSLSIPKETLIELIAVANLSDEGKLTIKNLEKAFTHNGTLDSFFESKTVYARTLEPTYKEFVEKLTEASWSLMFSGFNSVRFHLLKRLLEFGILTELPPNAMHAYKSSLIEIAEKQPTSINNEKENWRLLYKYVDKNKLSEIANAVLDELIKKGNITLEQFVFFEEILRECGDIKKHSQVFFQSLVSPLLVYNECLQLILANSSFYFRFLKTGSEETEELIAKTRTLLDADPNNPVASELLQKLESTFILDIKVTFARYYSEHNGKSEDVTNIVKDMVENKRMLYHRISNELVAEDPDPGKIKTLHVEFTYSNVAHVKEWKEHTFWSFPR